MKELFSQLLCVSLFICLSAPSVAAQAFNTDFPLITDVSMYAEQMTIKYLTVSNMNGEYQISQPYQIAGSTGTETYIYFVFNDNGSVAQLNVSFISGTFSSSFIQKNNELLDYAYTYGLPIALYAIEQNYYIWCQGISAQLNSEAPVETVTVSSIDIHNAMPVQLTHISAERTTRDSTLEIFLDDFPKVNSTIITVTVEGSSTQQVGLCWVACVSAVGKYETGDYYIPESIFRWARNNISYTGHYPVGSSRETRDALNGRYGLNYLSHTDPMTATSVWNTLLDDTPIIAAIRRVDADGNRIGHSVVICGAIMSGSDFYYYIMDPSESPTNVLVYIGQGNTTHFSYPSASQGTFTYWEGRVYQ